MSFDYNKLYGETRDALGAPTQIFVDFIEGFDRTGARVLDVGCGQGRDAIFIARKGHRVVGVDISPNGIRDLVAAAEKESLPIEGVVADVSNFQPEGLFDVILVDRTLHMLATAERLSVLNVLLDHVGPNGWLLIADEASNIKAFKDAVEEHEGNWETHLARRGYLFLQHS